MDDILSGKINNNYDPEKIYREIMEDENLLRNYKNFSSNKNAQTIATVTGKLGYAAFGPLLSSKYNDVDIENDNIRDMARLRISRRSSKKTKRTWIKNNDTITINNNTANFISTKTSW